MATCFDWTAIRGQSACKTVQGVFCLMICFLPLIGSITHRDVFYFVLTCYVMRACVCVSVCVGFVMCGFFDNCVGVLVICVLVFTVFCIVCTVFLYFFVYVYLFLFVLCVLV